MDPELVLAAMAAAWREADGNKFASHFTERGLFVAFDGSIHIGPEAIGEFHQAAFDGPLRGTTLAMAVTTARALGSDLHLILTRGGVCRPGRTVPDAATDSVQALIVRQNDVAFKIEVLYNGRYRPIRDAQSARIWHEFDEAARNLHEF